MARKAAKIPYPQSMFFSLFLVAVCWDSCGGVPLVYAEQAEVEKSEAALRFNCAQRMFRFVLVVVQKLTRRSLGAHANTLESIPFVLTTLVLRLNDPFYVS